MKLFQKGLILFVAAVLIAPLQAKTYLDVKFIEAFERRDIRQVEQCLSKGADVNLLLNSGKTPLMELVGRMVDNTKSCIEYQQKAHKELMLSLSGLPAAGALLFLAADPPSISYAREARLKITVLALSAYLFYGTYKFARASIVATMFFYTIHRMQANLKMLELLLKYPSIDLKAGSKDGETVLALADCYLKEIESNVAKGLLGNFKIRYLVKPLQKANELLKAKEMQSAAAGKGI